MNFTDLKYVIEIDKYGSISMAAKKLFIAQSNLSRAVKELEKEFDITIFERSAKGVVTTREGQQFLAHAREIQYEINSLRNSYSTLNSKGVNLKVSLPRASYISEVFCQYLSSLNDIDNMKIHYRETNSMGTIKNVLDYHFDFGIIRYNSVHEGYYLSLLQLKNLEHRLILEFDYVLLTSKNNAFAKQPIRSYIQLQDCIEVIHGDNRLPSGDYVDLSDNDREEHSQKKIIYIYERGSQFEILSSVPNTFMWVSPMPDGVLEKYGLVQLRCGALSNHMKDIMIFRKTHVATKCENDFLDILREKIREFGCYF